MPRGTAKTPPAFPGMTIGLLGGTFDPPHDGHRHISDMALKRLGLDRLWWLVTPGNPLKTRSGVTAFAKRLDKARAFARHPRIDVTGFEVERGSPYSADTIRFLVRRFPQTRFIWIMGMDNLVNFHEWALWREILATLPVAVLDRPGYRYAALSGRAATGFARYRVDDADARGLCRFHPPAWTILTMPLSPLSSTQLREGRD